MDHANPDRTNPDRTNPDRTNPDRANPDSTNPDWANPDRLGADDLDFDRRMPGTAAWLSLVELSRQELSQDGQVHAADLREFPVDAAAFVDAVMRRWRGAAAGVSSVDASPVDASPADVSPADVPPAVDGATHPGFGNGDADDATVAGHLLTPQRLASFRVPDPSPDFVARTLSRIQQDRSERYRALLARYIAPEPAPEFVARTLAALREDRNSANRSSANHSSAQRWPRRIAGWLAAGWSRPLAAAAVVLASVLWAWSGQAWQTGKESGATSQVAVGGKPSTTGTQAFNVADGTAPLATSRATESNLQPWQQEGFAQAPGRATPTVLAALATREDPMALAAGAADGLWLLQQRELR